ncbi:MAG: protein-disulfide reductase DsbD domain-containing protein [Micropepsaceae bacterium]
MYRIHISAVLFLFLLAGAAGADELATVWKEGGPSNSRMIVESGRLVPAGLNRAGIQIRMAPGWWTYWRAPGTSGIPPQFDWSGSKNLAGTPELIWPVPVRAVAYGESLNLYRDEIVFPVAFKAANPREPVILKLRLTYGICKNMCVPATVEHEISVGPTGRPAQVSSPNARLIAAYSVRQPSADPFSTGFEIREVWETSSVRRASLGLRIEGLRPARKPLVLVEGPGVFQASEITPLPANDEQQSTLIVPLGKATDLRRLTGKRIRITIIDGARALEQVWVVGTQSSSAVGVGLTPVSTGPGESPQP